MQFFFVMCLTDPLVGNDGNLTKYIQQMEQRVATLESQTMEQKHAAVLSNVLSKMSSQTDELVHLKTQTNSTADQLENLKKEVQEVKLNVNTFLEFELKSQRNASNLCFEHNGDSNTSNSFTAFRNRDVAFEARLLKSHSFKDGRLRLTNVRLNASGRYNPLTGVFTAPVSGTYQIWFSISFKRPTGSKHNEVVIVKLTVGRNTVASATDPPHNADQHIVINQPGVANGIYLISLEKNDEISLKISPNLIVTKPSTYGGVLIHSHFD